MDLTWSRTQDTAAYGRGPEAQLHFGGLYTDPRFQPQKASLEGGMISLKINRRLELNAASKEMSMSSLIAEHHKLHLQDTKKLLQHSAQSTTADTKHVLNYTVHLLIFFHHVQHRQGQVTPPTTPDDPTTM